jgi:3',5'-cyclic-AMP phosphodiesterase
MQRRSFLQTAGALAGAMSVPFALQAAPAKRSVRFAHITDIHVKPGEIPETGMAKALHHVQQLKQKPEFIINGGDSIMDALSADKQTAQQQFDLFKTILAKENSLPIHHCIGNHDVWGWFAKNQADVQLDSLWGKHFVLETYEIPGRYYSFTKGKWKFIVLDSTQLNPAGGYIARLDPPQYDWLEEELAGTPKNTYVCVVSHIPILSICAGLFFNKTEENGDLKIQRNLMHTDFLTLKKLFAEHPNVKVCLSGHIHLQDEVDYLGVKYYCNGAISGNWWKGDFQEFAPAYAIVELFDDGSSKRTMVEYDNS